MKWTDEQKRVYSVRGKNLLVSAAAGSGKTTVLIERLMRYLLDEEDPADIDEFLIVTFTRAAAGQLRDKIREAIAKALEERENDAHLRRQLLLINHARITTIDGFCRFVVKNYVSRIDLDPGFRQADQGEIDLLKNDVIKELLEEAYADEDPDFAEAFRNFSDTLAPGKERDLIGKTILRVYETAMSCPYPEEYYSLCRKRLGISEDGNNDNEEWLDILEAELSGLAEGGLQEARRFSELNERCGLPDKYRDIVTPYLDYFEKAVCCHGSYAELFALSDEMPTKGFPGGRAPKAVDGSVFAEMKKSKEKLAETVKAMTALLPYSPQVAEKYRRESAPSLLMLIDMAERFGKAFGEKKRQKNIADFSDMAHYALAVLRDENKARTQAARELAVNFREVMIDEYQDSNFLQEEILTAVSGIEDGRDNYFCVGDVKQSIYRFRQARPELFTDKFDRYGRGEGGERIDLRDNFRSRPEILTCVNRIFESVMRSEVGGISYDENHALKTGQTGEVLTDSEGTADVMPEILISTDKVPASLSADGEAADLSKAETEAEAVAGKILELMTGHFIEKTETGEKRPLEYRDIVILLRSMKGTADVFVRVLERRGIPCLSTEQKGFFDAPEILTVLNLLSVLDNPRQDIPLAAVLHSPIGALTAGDLARIRSFSLPGEDREKENLIDDVVFFSEKGPEGDLKKKLSDLLASFADMRFRASFTPIHELITGIIRETGYRDYVSAMPGGEKKCLNLDMLIEKAVAYEETSYVGLYNFIRYIRRLEEYDIDQETAGGNENEDLVRIVSIHKSKGLEYPVVFVCGCGKLFNKSDERSHFIIHPSLGIAADHVDLKERIRHPGLMKKAFSVKLSTESMGEELRILYVAMTRARLKLIMSGTVATDKETGEPSFTEYRQIRPEDGHYAAGYIRSAKNYFSLILPPVLLAADREEPFAGLDIRQIGLLLTDREEKGREGRERLEEIRHMAPEQIRDEKFRRLLDERFSYVYPYEERREIPAKLSVSDVKHMKMEDEEARERFEEAEVLPFIPAFMKEKKETGELSGAAYGTAVHKVMSLLDMTGSDIPSEEAVRDFVNSLKEKGTLQEEEAAHMPAGRISLFARSSMGRRLHEAALRGQLFREQPFSMSIPASCADPAWSEEENILIQGIIDVYFEEDGQLILLDYKTDAVSDGEELVSRYRAQLDLYAGALERALKKPVREKHIWSFSLNKDILLG